MATTLDGEPIDTSDWDWDWLREHGARRFDQFGQCGILVGHFDGDAALLWFGTSNSVPVLEWRPQASLQVLPERSRR